MLAETLVVTSSALIGRLVSNHTKQEVEEWKKLLRIVPALVSSVVLWYVFYVSNTFLIMVFGLIGGILTALFYKKERFGISSRESGSRSDSLGSILTASIPSSCSSW